MNHIKWKGSSSLQPFPHWECEVYFEKRYAHVWPYKYQLKKISSLPPEKWKGMSEANGGGSHADFMVGFKTFMHDNIRIWLGIEWNISREKITGKVHRAFSSRKRPFLIQFVMKDKAGIHGGLWKQPSVRMITSVLSYFIDFGRLWLTVMWQRGESQLKCVMRTIWLVS